MKILMLVVYSLFLSFFVYYLTIGKWDTNPWIVASTGILTLANFVRLVYSPSSTK